MGCILITCFHKCRFYILDKWYIMSQYLQVTDSSGAQLPAKEALLEWAQSKVASYPGVKVDNLTTSFQDGK